MSRRLLKQVAHNYWFVLKTVWVKTLSTCHIILFVYTTFFIFHFFKNVYAMYSIGISERDWLSNYRVLKIEGFGGRSPVGEAWGLPR